MRLRRRLFADTFYWVAVTDPKDPWHARAVAASEALGAARIVTTELVLVEVLNFFADAGPHWRRAVVKAVRAIRHSAQIDVVPCAAGTSLEEGLEFYADRGDKGYSLIDCVSMLCMRREQIHEVLTHDHHFAQEGFALLLS